LWRFLVLVPFISDEFVEDEVVKKLGEYLFSEMILDVSFEEFLEFSSGEGVIILGETE
jgi:hypothetical protein